MIRLASSRLAAILLLPGLSLVPAARLEAQQGAVAVGDSVTFKFIETDLRAVASGLAPYLGKPLLQLGVPGTHATLETPQPVPRTAVVGLLRRLAEGYGLELIEDSLAYTLHPKNNDPPPVAAAAGGIATIDLHVIRLKHARAPDIAAAVNQLFGNGGEFAGRTGISRATLSDQLQASAQPPVSSAAPVGGGGASLTGQVTIVPDVVTNSLLIRATPADFALIDTAIAQLDIRPLQVLIEVMVVEARKDRNFSLGADITVAPQPVAGGGTVSGETQGGGLGDAILHLMQLHHGDVDAVIRTAESRGDVQILSRPVVIAANNTEASFMVGTERPFISENRVLPTDNGVSVRTTSYKQVGTRLTVLPTINYDGYVALEILQEIDQATDESAGDIDAPIISTREAHTQVLVRDGQTIVIGGLRDRQRESSQSGVPFLSRIPILGGLFGAASRKSTETELYLFLTPRILRTDEDVDRATAQRMSPELKEEAP